MTAVDREDLLQLHGKSLQIYWRLLKRGEAVGVREMQRELGLSSPSVASHHLEKLKDLGLVGKDEHGRYFLVQRVDVGILQAFTKLGRLVLPRYFFYAAFFTTLMVTYLIMFADSPNIFAIAFPATAAGVFWYETVRIWRRRPV